MRAFLPIISALLCGCGQGAVQDERAQPSRHRVVSTSLCGDAYVLSMLADEDITALSWQSVDKLSTAPARSYGKPQAHDDIEILLALNPTLVVFGPGEGAAAKALLERQGIDYVNLAWGENFETVWQNYKPISAALRLPDLHEKQAMIDYHNLQKTANVPTNKPTVFYLSSSGGTAGPDTYVDAVIKAAGGVNIITKPGWHNPDPETLIGLTPDLVVTSFFEDGYVSVNEAGLRSHALQDKLAKTPTVNVPGKLWPCAGPGLFEATDIIAAKIERLN